jgi:hypothetical protein
LLIFRVFSRIFHFLFVNVTYLFRFFMCKLMKSIFLSLFFIYKNPAIENASAIRKVCGGSGSGSGMDWQWQWHWQWQWQWYWQWFFGGIDG